MRWSAQDQMAAQLQVSETCKMDKNTELDAGENDPGQQFLRIGEQATC